MQVLRFISEIMGQLVSTFSSISTRSFLLLYLPVVVAVNPNARMFISRYPYIIIVVNLGQDTTRIGDLDHQKLINVSIKVIILFKFSYA